MSDPLDSIDAPFALCLTHDVDRPFKRATHGLFYALQERPGYHLRTALPDRNPYWQFDAVTDVEAERGVRSAFYFLDQPHALRREPSQWLSARTWLEELGRYDLDRPSVGAAMGRLAEGGWEVGLHGSLASADDPDRLREEKQAIEAALGDDVIGCRQHHLRLDRPGTWRAQRAAGLRYDASLGSGTAVGFEHGYEPLRPFDDDFLVFPLTLMEQALPDPGRAFEAAWETCEELLAEAAENGAVMTVLWHLRYFNEREFPGHRRLYERLVDRALELGAWVGPPGELYGELVDDARPAPGPGAV